MKEDITGIEGQMKAGFAAVDQRFEKVEGEMKAGFKETDRQFSTIRERLAKIETKPEGLVRLERLVLGFGSALLIAVIGPHFF